MTSNPTKLREHLMASAPTYLSSFMDDLKRQTVERRAKRDVEAAATVVDPLAVLKQKIREWHRALSPEARPDCYHMDTLVKLLRTPPQQLGIALHELGWTRRRVWKKGAPYRQTWRAPDAWQRGNSNESE